MIILTILVGLIVSILAVVLLPIGGMLVLILDPLIAVLIIMVVFRMIKTIIKYVRRK